MNYFTKRDVVASIIVFLSILGVISVPIIFLHIGDEKLYLVLIGFLAGVGASEIIRRLLDELC